MQNAMPHLESAVRKSVRVQAPVARAWSVFVEQMESWWPATHHVGSTPFETIYVEPRAGGRWYERNANGALCDWGTVLTWEPPRRVTFSWHLGPGHDSPEWRYDPDIAHSSEVEFRFVADGPDATTVEMTHSKLERHGQGWEALRALFDGPGAWVDVLASYRKVVEG